MTKSIVNTHHIELHRSIVSLCSSLNDSLVLNLVTLMKNITSLIYTSKSLSRFVAFVVRTVIIKVAFITKFIHVSLRNLTKRFNEEQLNVEDGAKKIPAAMLVRLLFAMINGYQGVRIKYCQCRNVSPSPFYSSY